MIFLYPYITPGGITQTWDTATEQQLFSDKHRCEQWLWDNRDMGILRYAEVFVDKKSWDTGIVIRAIPVPGDGFGN